jgi:hypothetical protein
MPDAIMAPTTVKAPMLLTIPTELKFRIYEEVFAGSDMRVRVVILGRYMNQQILRCTNPEQYKVLRTCKQLEQEAAPILAACTTLFLGSTNGNSRDSVQLLQYCKSPRAPRFLRQAIPYLSNIKLYLEDGTFAKLLSCLSPFVRLRELRFSTSENESDCVPEAIAQCPLLLLGTAHDGVFVESVKRGVTSMPRYHSVSDDAEPLEYTVNTPQDVLKVLTDSPTQYDVIWESEVRLIRHRSAWEPVGSTIRAPKTALNMVRSCGVFTSQGRSLNEGRNSSPISKQMQYCRRSLAWTAGRSGSRIL